ncbi:hypothetical protein PR048_006226 [Dryococelus australis]|uniref:DUF4371 domain-containing protein n=1 Tax=Dryococelus australis TaxID=614101 RepID=A0ABQ9IAG3_9NEOP|nr:hypothetical protein PR048_006226 [Dryococelus australis]
MNAKGKKNQSFQRNWLEMYEWLAYSKKVSGGLCKRYILFGRCEGGTNNVKLGKLVVTPLNTYKKAVETLKHHASTDYRKGNMIASHNFLMVMDGKYDDKTGKKKLFPIIKTIIFYGASNIPLRGHRDDGDLQTESEKKYAKGNFRALLKFRIDAGDEILASHIGLCNKNARYISKTTQNKIIQCCGDATTEKIFPNIKNTKYFTIMADETTDISIKEYFDNTLYEIQEKFFKFIDIADFSGENIARTILQELDRLNLDISYCRSQAYEGDSNMSGKFKGVQAHIAKYSHYANHKKCYWSNIICFKLLSQVSWVNTQTRNRSAR